MHGLSYVKIVGPVGEIYGPFAMVAQRHLHCTVNESKELCIKNGDMIKMSVGWVRSMVFDSVVVRVRDDYVLDFHIDLEEANAANLSLGDWAEIIV